VPAPAPAAAPPVPPRFTWVDVAPILERRCGACHGHVPRFFAPMPLATFEHVVLGRTADGAAMHVRVGERIADAQRPMPPAAAGVAGLPPDERQVLLTWVADGAPYSPTALRPRPADVRPVPPEAPPTAPDAGTDPGVTPAPAGDAGERSGLLGGMDGGPAAGGTPPAEPREPPVDPGEPRPPPPPTAPVETLSDPFLAPVLDPDWNVMNGQALGIQTGQGRLSLTVQSHALWFHGEQGTLVYKYVLGDFALTSVVRSRCTSDRDEPANRFVHLGGLMARDPDPTAEN